MNSTVVALGFLCIAVGLVATAIGTARKGVGTYDRGGWRRESVRMSLLLSLPTLVFLVGVAWMILIGDCGSRPILRTSDVDGIGWLWQQTESNSCQRFWTIGAWLFATVVLWLIPTVAFVVARRRRTESLTRHSLLVGFGFLVAYLAGAVAAYMGWALTWNQVPRTFHPEFLWLIVFGFVVLLGAVLAAPVAPGAARPWMTRVVRALVGVVWAFPIAHVLVSLFVLTRSTLY